MQTNADAKYNHWTKDLSNSVEAIKCNLYYINQYIQGEIISIEKHQNYILCKLDEYSGIDLINIKKDQQIRGIASRVQWGLSYETFTIRSKRWTGTKTEFDKRSQAIEEGYFYPELTMQMYCKDEINNKLLSIGIVKTIDLYRFIDFYPECVYKNISDNEFIYVKWQDLKVNGVRIIQKIFNNEMC